MIEHDSNNYLYSDISEKIIKAFYNVYNKLGYGFLEKVYENSLMIELKKFNLECENQKRIDVFYDHNKVGEYYADIIVENKIIVELKTFESLSKEHEIQLVNYLKGSNIEVGLLLNFGKEPQHRRKVFSKNYKS